MQISEPKIRIRHQTPAHDLNLTQPWEPIVRTLVNKVLTLYCIPEVPSEPVPDIWHLIRT